MITGIVTTDREAVIELVVRGPTGLEEIVELVDCGVIDAAAQGA